jgi:hypothetical protein
MSRGNTVIEELELRIAQMRDGTYTHCDGAILVTRDASSGILTFSYPALTAAEGMELFERAAQVRGFVKEAVHASD